MLVFSHTNFKVVYIQLARGRRIVRSTCLPQQMRQKAAPTLAARCCAYQQALLCPLNITFRFLITQQQQLYYKVRQIETNR